MDQIDVLLAERACERVICEYAERLDGGRPDSIWELFTEDGVWEMPGGKTFRGRDELATDGAVVLWTADRVTMHFCTNIIVRVTSPTEAIGHCYFFNQRADFASAGAVERPAPPDVPRYVGEYHDTFTLTSEGWRIAHRFVAVNFGPAQARPTDS